MASLFFADQKAQQSVGEPESFVSETSGNQDHPSTISDVNEFQSQQEYGGSDQQNDMSGSSPPGQDISNMPTANVDYVGPASSNDIKREEEAAVTPAVTTAVSTQHTPREANNQKEPNNNNRCLLIIIIIVCCIIVLGAVGAGVAVALTRKSDNEGKKAKGDSPQTTSPPAQASPMPSPPPTPPPTTQPTETPTSIPRPENDECEEASVLSTNSKILGTTFDALPDVDAVDSRCGIILGDGFGVWYEVEGNGLYLTASTCSDDNPFQSLPSFDTKISVYTGTCGGNLQCVDFNDDDDFCSSNNAASTIGWDSFPGTTYYILVNGYEFGFGDFELTIQETPLLNDFCDGAAPLESDGSITIGTTFPATVDDVPACGDVTVNAPGVWYTFVGTGELLVATTCFGTSYDTQLTLFVGDGCGELECFEANDDHCGQQSSIIFDSVEGEVYYLLVHGFFAEGVFGVSIATNDNLYNNFCVESHSLELSTPVTGTTEFATFGFSDAFSCFQDTVQGPNVWYTIIGTGGTLLASLCEDETNYDTQITILSGECSALFCVASNDDSEFENCDLFSTVSWESEFLTTYYVLVHGFGNATGTFGLFVEDISATDLRLDSCENAGGPFPLSTPRDVSRFVVDVAVDRELLSSCGRIQAEETNLSGSWFFGTGDGGQMNVSWCDNLDIQVTVFEGNCSELSCLDGTDHGCAFSWQSEILQNYYFLVSNSTESMNDYSIALETSGPPPAVNDICSGAIMLDIDAEPLLSSTESATENVDFAGDTCGEPITSPGVWYKVAGQNTTLTVSLCSLNAFDTRVAVFDGDCGSLNCVGGNDDLCGLQSAFAWEAAENSTYFILVHGFSSQVGNFGIEVFSGSGV